MTDTANKGLGDNALGELQRKVKLSWWICLICYVLVAVFIVVQTLIKEPAATQPPLVTGIWLFIKLLPWLLFLVSFYRQKPNGFILLCFASLLYFCFAGVEAMGEHAAAFWARLEVAVLAGVFVSAMMFARWKKQLPHFGQANEN